MGSVLIHPNDNVAVNLDNGHKYAVCDIRQGEKIIKYGYPIGVAKENICKAEHVHTHNLKTALKENEEYTYTPFEQSFRKEQPITVSAYIRKNGDVGIRNDIWIIPTVGCINDVANLLAKKTGVFPFTHPYGCSQLGNDLLITQKTLSSLITHPNAGGVLVLGLGCENNNITELKRVLEEFDCERVRFLNIQDCDDEIAEGTKIIDELKYIASKDIRSDVPISKIRIGMKCGGSDGLSGITANPLCGRITDKMVSMGAAVALTEVPEMFGAEQILMNRCVNEDVFTKTANLIENFKNYYLCHGQPISENPSPGNKDGGITTLEEKSLGCVQKGGTAPITAVLDYGDKMTEKGLNLVNGPGNDAVAVTNLTAVGCHLILFTTGRGTPLGAPVPTIKISTNSALSFKKKHWIDFDAQSGDESSLMKLIVQTINGKETKNEQLGYREIAIFKDGVTL